LSFESPYTPFSEWIPLKKVYYSGDAPEKTMNLKTFVEFCKGLEGLKNRLLLRQAVFVSIFFNS